MQADHFFLAANDWVPNNTRLPVIIYSGVTAGHGTLAESFERLFSDNGWQGVWRNGIYGYHHYHTTAHEVLGIASGRATVVLGGEGGRVLEVAAGDCLILPAGTGHCRIEASGDFLVIGAYPPGQDPDLKTDAASVSEKQRIETLTIPATDPLGGEELPKLWK